MFLYIICYLHPLTQSPVRPHPLLVTFQSTAPPPHPALVDDTKHTHWLNRKPDWHPSTPALVDDTKHTHWLNRKLAWHHSTYLRFLTFYKCCSVLISLILWRSLTGWNVRNALYFCGCKVSYSGELLFLATLEFLTCMHIILIILLYLF